MAYVMNVLFYAACDPNACQREQVVLAEEEEEEEVALEAALARGVSVRTRTTMKLHHWILPAPA